MKLMINQKWGGCARIIIPAFVIIRCSALLINSAKVIKLVYIKCAVNFQDRI
jgi:hypothetical protein